MLRVLLVLCVALLAFLPPFFGPEWEGTEGRRAAIAQEMRRSHDYVIPTLGGAPTLAKPPLAYALMAALADPDGRILHWRARLPGMVSICLLGVLLLRVASTLVSRRAGLLAALAFVSMPLVLSHAATAEIDPLFAAFTGGGVLLLVSALCSAGGTGTILGSGVLLGLALLTKGPPILLFVLPVAVAAPRGIPLRRWALLAAVAVAVPLAWAAAAWSRVGWSEFWDVVGEESVGRSSAFTLKHILDTPLFLFRAPGTALPWVPFALVALGLPRGTARRAVLLGLACFAGSVLLLCFFPARPTRYLVPAAAPLALACGAGMDRFLGAGSTPPSWARLLPVTGVASGIALAVAAFADPWWLLALPPALLVAGLLFPLWTTRPGMIAGLVALAVVVHAGFTIDLDRRLSRSARAMAPAIAALRPYLAGEPVFFYGHVRSHAMLLLDQPVRQDEFQSAAPPRPLFLSEETDGDPSNTARALAVHGKTAVDRVRVRMDDRSLVLSQLAGTR